MSMPRMEPDVNRGGSATIGKAVKIVGQIFSREDLYVDGDVEGTIELENLADVMRVQAEDGL